MLRRTGLHLCQVCQPRRRARPSSARVQLPLDRDPLWPAAGGAHQAIPAVQGVREACSRCDRHLWPWHRRRARQHCCTYLVSRPVAEAQLTCPSRRGVQINYDAPGEADSYLHRVGRAGRFGTKGLAISFISNEGDEEVLKAIQSRFEVAITELPESIEPSSYSTSHTCYLVQS